MVVYFHNNPDKKAKCNTHKKFRIELVHELVDDWLAVKPEYLARGRRPSSIDVRMKGKHFFSSLHPVRRRCCVCGYKKGPSGQYKDTKTSNYCVKCDKFLCKSCFETYHTKSNF